MANISTENIAGFDEMTPEQKVEALLGVEIPEQVDLSAYVKKSVFDAKAAEASNLSKQLKSKMSEDEQRKAAEEEAKQAENQKFADLESKYQELLKNSTLKEHTISLTGLGFDEKLAGETANAIVEGDASKLFANMKKFLDNYRKSIEKELMDKTPSPAGTVGEDEDPAVKKAKALFGNNAGTGKTYADVMSHYKK